MPWLVMMPTALTPQQSLAMVYARLLALRTDVQLEERGPLDPLRAGFNAALDDLYRAGFDLSSFKLDGGEEAGDRDAAGLQPRLDAVLDYMVLLAGLP